MTDLAHRSLTHGVIAAAISVHRALGPGLLENVLLELKAIDRLLPIHDAQLLTYLKLCRIKVGLLINFNSSSLRNGIRRLIR